MTQKLVTATKQDVDKRRKKNFITVLSKTDTILVKKSDNV